MRERDSSYIDLLEIEKEREVRERRIKRKKRKENWKSLIVRLSSS